MPPKAAQDAKADSLTLKERQVIAAAHARASKQKGQAAQPNGTMRLGDLPKISDDTGPPPQQGAGVSSDWLQHHPDRLADWKLVDAVGYDVS